MSSSRNDTTPGQFQGGASDMGRGSPKIFQGPNESSPPSSRPTSDQGTTDDVMARINRIADFMDKNKKLTDAYLDVVGSSDYQTRIQTAKKYCKVVKWVDEDRRNWICAPKYFYEVDKLKSIAELEKEMEATLALLETKIARQTAMKKAMIEVFALMGDD